MDLMRHSIHHLFVKPDYQHELARALGFEPRSKVLETSILPLNYARESKTLCKIAHFLLHVLKSKDVWTKYPGEPGYFVRELI